jgi:hypothetical protein
MRRLAFTVLHPGDDTFALGAGDAELYTARGPPSGP